MRCRPAIPGSCRGLDLTDIERTLFEKRGNVSAAATALGLPSADLRQLVWSIPSLGDVVYEKLEQAIDEAEQAVRDGLKSQSMSERLAAANLMLKSAAARRRGWGRETSHNEPVEPRTVTLKWLDEPKLN
jgi:hypothetical protein